MTVERSPWGSIGDARVDLHTLTNANGLVARITDYGATLVELHVPDRHGVLTDVALGFDTLDEYIRTSFYFGATVGRAANRIADAAFELRARRYELFANHGRHHLHGGREGWDKSIWSAEADDTPDGSRRPLQALVAGR